MGTSFRCMICGRTDEPHGGLCACGASRNVTTAEARRVIRRALRVATLETAGCLLLVAIMVSGVIAPGPSRPGEAILVAGLMSFGACIGLVALGYAARKLLRTRARLAAVPALPRAAVLRHEPQHRE